VAVFVVCLAAFGAPALAGQTFEIVADSTLDGNAGFLMQITEPGENGATVFMFEEAGMIRMYAMRAHGFDFWVVFPGGQYICPVSAMSINDTWRFLDDEGIETIATVIGLESITTAAGTFACYTVVVEDINNRGTVLQTLWFSSGIGLVREMDFFEGPTPINWQSDLQSYNISGGSGFFPLAVGNRWDYAEITNPTQATTWGAIKSKYDL
jgi:hypothetical protein